MPAQSDRNPDAVPDAPEPTIEYIKVDRATIYTEVRGSGDPVLLIGAADEDAEVYRGIAERLAKTQTVVSYDRRGTGRSDRSSWPANSNRHADDAAALIDSLGLDNVVVLGASAGGIVALRLAVTHPDLLKTVLCYEPGIFDMAEEGEGLRDRIENAVDSHLQANPGDWQGATDVLGKEAARSVDDLTSLLDPAPDKDWFVHRAGANAEALIRGDLPMTRERFDPNAVAHCPVQLRFSHGTASLPVFGFIASNLAGIRGESPDTLEGLSHSIFYHPDQAANYVSRWT